MAHAQPTHNAEFSTLSRNGLFSGIDVISIDLSSSALLSFFCVAVTWIKSYSQPKLSKINGQKYKKKKKQRGRGERVAKLLSSFSLTFRIDVIPTDGFWPFGSLLHTLLQRRVCRCQSCPPRLPCRSISPRHKGL